MLVLDDLMERHAGEVAGPHRTQIEAQYPGYLGDRGEHRRRPPAGDDDVLLEQVLRAIATILTELDGADDVVAVTLAASSTPSSATWGADFQRIPTSAPARQRRRHRPMALGERLLLVDPDEVLATSPTRSSGPARYSPGAASGPVSASRSASEAGRAGAQGQGRRHGDGAAPCRAGCGPARGPGSAAWWGRRRASSASSTEHTSHVPCGAVVEAAQCGVDPSRSAAVASGRPRGQRPPGGLGGRDHAGSLVAGRRCQGGSQGARRGGSSSTPSD